MGANVRGLPQGGPKDTLRQASVRGSASLFSREEVQADNDRLNQGLISKATLRKKYGKNMIGFVKSGDKFSIAISKSILRDAMDA